jgi:hypothetical protein
VRAAIMCARFLCACCDSNVFRVCIINWWIFFLSVFFLACCRVFLGSLAFDYAHARNVWNLYCEMSLYSTKIGTILVREILLLASLIKHSFCRSLSM